jgi:hypothetical protein
MKHFILIAVFLFALPLVALAQITENSVCVDPQKQDAKAKPVVLQICRRGKGMTALPQYRLFLQVYADGSAEFEENPPFKEGADKTNYTLVKYKLKIAADKVKQIIKLGTAKDFQDAAADYAALRMWTDSGLDTTVVFRNNGKDKKVVVHNFSATELANDEYYPPSLVGVLLLAEKIRTPNKAEEPVIASHSPKVFAYTGGLQLNLTYRGKVNFGSAYGMTLTPWPRLPRHHSVMYSWPNVKNFPELDPDKSFGVRTIVFRVVGREVDGVRKNEWITTFTIEILKVE